MCRERSRKHNSMAHSASAKTSARLYEAVRITPIKTAAAARTSGAGARPNICAAPAIPANSVTSAAKFVTSMVPSESHAQPSP